MKTRNLILWTVAIVTFAIVNYQSYQREMLKANGRVILLELAPVDPRSLMQGDYMQLRYALAEKIGENTDLDRGNVIVRVDSNNVAHYVGIYKEESPAKLQTEEILLPFRRDYDIYIGPESFFFQEGHADYYENAKYGEFRISESGSILLVGLRDEKFVSLRPPE